jgi:hypothetical protein
MNLKTKIDLNYKNYVLQDWNHSELLDILGDRFWFEEKSIQEILESELRPICHEPHDWFLRATANLEKWIERAFYRKIYPIEKIDDFFYNFYNEKELLKASQPTEDDLNEFDAIWDLYVKVLRELNFDL